MRQVQYTGACTSVQAWRDMHHLFQIIIVFPLVFTIQSHMVAKTVVYNLQKMWHCTTFF